MNHIFLEKVVKMFPAANGDISKLALRSGKHGVIELYAENDPEPRYCLILYLNFVIRPSNYLSNEVYEEWRQMILGDEISVAEFAQCANGDVWRKFVQGMAKDNECVVMANSSEVTIYTDCHCDQKLVKDRDGYCLVASSMEAGEKRIPLTNENTLIFFEVAEACQLARIARAKAKLESEQCIMDALLRFAAPIK